MLVYLLYSLSVVSIASAGNHLFPLLVVPIICDVHRPRRLPGGELRRGEDEAVVICSTTDRARGRPPTEHVAEHSRIPLGALITTGPGRDGGVWALVRNEKQKCLCQS